MNNPFLECVYIMFYGNFELFNGFFSKTVWIFAQFCMCGLSLVRRSMKNKKCQLFFRAVAHTSSVGQLKSKMT